MIGCLRTRVRKQPIIALYFESETVLKFYNLESSTIKAVWIQCLAQEHNTVPQWRTEPDTPQFQIEHYLTEPLYPSAPLTF